MLARGGRAGIQEFVVFIRICKQVIHFLSAIVEIEAEELAGALSVPVQAIRREDGIDWCYVMSPNGVQRRDVKLGGTNTNHVQLLDGMSEGERVVLKRSVPGGG